MDKKILFLGLDAAMPDLVKKFVGEGVMPNTAKLMDENKTLYKLKELEYLERICEKVGEISVNGNMGIVEQLGRMIGATA